MKVGLPSGQWGPGAEPAEGGGQGRAQRWALTGEGGKCHSRRFLMLAEGCGNPP